MRLWSNKSLDLLADAEEDGPSINDSVNLDAPIGTRIPCFFKARIQFGTAWRVPKAVFENKPVFEEQNVEPAEIDLD
jgi:hypothetical protein